jgi:carboxypeptidase D
MPSKPIFVREKDIVWGSDDGQGWMGTQHFERGLMWASTNLAGHQQPQFQPRVSLLHLEWVLGRRETL